LGQVADVSRAGDRARVRLALAGEDPHRRRLPGAVPADQADPIPRLDTQRRPGPLEEGADAGAYLEVVDGEHVRGHLTCGRRAGLGGRWACPPRYRRT